MVLNTKDIEKEEKIIKIVNSELEFLREKILEASEYTDKILFRTQQATHSKCEYLFDEYPYQFSQKVFDDGSYVSYEYAVDEVRCEKYTIYLEIERVIMMIGKIDLILPLKIKEIRVKKRE